MNIQLNREIARHRRPFLVVCLMILLMLVAGSTSAAGEPGLWTPTRSMTQGRGAHTATRLANGHVLVAGGYSLTDDAVLSSAELYDPESGTWSPAPDMNIPRSGHVATLLQNGQVLVIGGWGLQSAELFDPVTSAWIPTGSVMFNCCDTATLLADGSVLATGNGAAALYDPASGSWTRTADMNEPRRFHPATLLNSGRVLVAGGEDARVGGEGHMLASAELYDPAQGSWALVGDLQTARDNHTAELLADGRVLVAGGWTGSAHLKSAEIFNPSTETFSPTGGLNTARSSSKSVLLPNGHMLYAGGIFIDSAEEYDPATGIWAITGSMSDRRSDPALTVLPNGQVLATGGFDYGGELDSADLYISLPACPYIPGNIVQNPCFEWGEGPWQFYSNGWGNFETTTPAYDGSFAGRVEILSTASNVQLYQYNLPIWPDQPYLLYFAAKSSDGSDMRVYLHQHTRPYTNYGLNGKVIDLTTEWQQFAVPFTTNDMTGPNGRLRFWLAPYAAAGTVYWFDNVYLFKVTDGVLEPPDPNPVDLELPPPGECRPPIAGNVVGNPGFEARAMTPWSFYSNGKGYMMPVASTAYECTQSARVLIKQQGSNVQLFQPGLILQPNTAYRLRLAAKSTDGRDVRLYLHKHGPPYNNYGLNGLPLDLTEEWQLFVVQFTTTNFSLPVSDGRLRIWLAGSDAPNVQYYFDDVVMVPLSMVASAVPESLGRLQSPSQLDRQATVSAVAASQVLTSGYFIDDDDAGRAQGAFVPRQPRARQCEQAQPSHTLLWPADGRMVKVKIVGAGKPAKLTIDGIWQDEPVGAEPDGVIVGEELLLRAERLAGGSGRVYHVAFTATYHNGLICSHEVLVNVPLQKGAGSLLFDNGPLAASTGQ